MYLCIYTIHIVQLFWMALKCLWFFLSTKYSKELQVTINKKKKQLREKKFTYVDRSSGKTENGGDRLSDKC